MFNPTEIIGRCDSDNAVGIRILIDHWSSGVHTLEAQVVVLGVFFSSFRLWGPHNGTQGFILGETLTLTKIEGDSLNWSISKPNFRPWYILHVSEEGVKTFEHYR